jgi:uncharacterized protein (TIGR02301 family)
LEPDVINSLRVITAIGLAASFLLLSPPASFGQEQTAPQQKQLAGPDDRPYDTQLFRLAELLGALHYLRALCGSNEGQTWREQMHELVLAEGTSTLRRARLVETFNRGYRGYSRTYRTCTPTALTANQHFMEQAQTLSDAILASDK